MFNRTKNAKGMKYAASGIDMKPAKVGEDQQLLFGICDRPIMVANALRPK